MARRKPAPSLDSFQQRSTVLSAPNLSLPALVSDMEDPQYQLQEQPGQRPLPQAPQYQGGYQHQQLRPYSHPSANVHSHSFDSNGGNFLHVSSPAPSVVMPNQVPPVFQHPQPDLLGARIPSYGNRYQVQSQYDIEKQDYYAPQVHTPRPATAYSERYAPPSIDYGHYAPQRADYYENTSSYSQWDVDSTYATDMGDKEESLTYNEDPDVVQRFGVPPEAPLARRRKKKRKVVLTEGNLVLDLPIPEKLMLGSNNVLEEMTSVRYTAVTCDADDFEAERYSLRQNWSGRETELMIGITMFNEDEVLLTRTLYGVMQGISHLCSRKNSKTWGHEAWKKVVVCIISDGRKNIHPRVCDCLAALGVYQEGVMKSRVKDKDVTAHVFEYTTTFALDPDLHFKYPDKGIVPCQIIFCLKEKNAKKINSHRWFFNAFGKQLQPNVCILLDVGTRPGVKSLYHLWKAFDVNSNIGGACGEIAAYKGPYWSWLINPLVAAQNFEYKMSNILDKPFESICGYISVLPGAFSAYRYIALQNDRNGVGPLASYFKGEVLGGGDTDIFTSNMYLAEDRILCFELVAKRNANWVLKYVKSAVGETDVPDSLPEFIMQRRRWLNGSLFAAFYALAHLPQMLRSGHGFIRKIVLVSEAFFSFVSIVFAWFGIANYYLFFVILTTALEDPIFGIEAIRVFNYFSHFAYGAALAGVFILAMGNKPKASAWKYKLATMLFSLLTIYLLACAVVCAIRASQKSDQGLYARMLLSIVATYGIYFAASVLALDPWHMFTSFIPFLILSPMYLNILSIYAFCNLDDISWGTKDDGKIEELEAVKEADAETGMVEVEVLAGPADVNKAYLEALNNIKMRKQFPPSKHQSMVGISAAEKEQNTRNYYANVRTNVLLSWVLTNAILVVFILSDNSAKETFGDSATGSKTRTYMTCVLAFVALTSAVVRLFSTR